VPPPLPTETSTSPAACLGSVTVISVLLTTLRLVARMVPKCTAVAPLNPRPRMVTLMPPAVGPFVGDTDVTVATAARIVSANEAVTAPAMGVRLGWVTVKKQLVQPARLAATVMEPVTVAPCKLPPTPEYVTGATTPEPVVASHFAGLPPIPQIFAVAPPPGYEPHQPLPEKPKVSPTCTTVEGTAKVGGSG
jgi:hypothetical protein